MDEKSKKYIVIGIAIIIIVAMISLTAVIINTQNTQNNNAVNSSINNVSNNIVSSSDSSSSDNSVSSSDSGSHSAEYIEGEKVVDEYDAYSPQAGKVVHQKITSSGKEYDYNPDGSPAGF